MAPSEKCHAIYPAGVDGMLRHTWRVGAGSAAQPAPALQPPNSEERQTLCSRPGAAAWQTRRVGRAITHATEVLLQAGTNTAAVGLKPYQRRTPCSIGASHGDTYS